MAKNTKEKILKSAHELIRFQNPAALSIIAVAKKAKISHTLLLYHYPSIDALMLDLIKEVVEELRKITIEQMSLAHSNPKKTVEAYLKAPFIWFDKHPEKIKLWFYFYSRSTDKGAFRDLNNSVRRVGRDRIATIFYEGVAKKVFKPKKEISIEKWAFQLQSQITGLLVQLHTEDSSIKMNEALEELVKNVFLDLGI